MVVWSKTGQRTFYNVTVDLNLDPLRKILKDTFPNEQIVSAEFARFDVAERQGFEQRSRRPGDGAGRDLSRKPW